MNKEIKREFKEENFPRITVIKVDTKGQNMDDFLYDEMACYIDEVDNINDNRDVEIFLYDNLEE